MSCKAYKEMLHSYANYELSELDQADVTRHLENCIPCSHEIQEIKRLKGIAKTIKLDELNVNMSFIKNNIMSAIRASKKVSIPRYDLRVLSSLGASMIACGILIFFVNFTPLGSNLQGHRVTMSASVQSISQKMTQPIAFLSRGLTEITSDIINLNGITYRIEQKVRGGK